MRRSQTYLALLAVILASVAAMPVRGRLIFAFAAILLLIALTASLLRAAATKRGRTPAFDAYERAERIRNQRNRS